MRRSRRRLTSPARPAPPAAIETATRALDQLGAGSGRTLLISGASGSVGSAAVQLAVVRGARMIGTASPANHGNLRSLGPSPSPTARASPGGFARSRPAASTPRSKGAGGGPLPITASRMGCLQDPLSHAYDVLGFGQAAAGEEVFRDLVLARIIEPTSKLDSLRVLARLPSQPSEFCDLPARIRVHTVPRSQDHSAHLPICVMSGRRSGASHHASYTSVVV